MSDSVIRTNKDKCKTCYACVRNCPVKAVRMVNGKAEIIQERCISCGNCIKVCSQNAKETADIINVLKYYLRSGNRMVALLAPSYPAVVGFEREVFIGALKDLGFSYVWEVAVGAEAIIAGYTALDYNSRFYISTPCPAVVNLIEMHYPSLVNNLAPVVSPAAATAKIVRKVYDERNMKLVFIGPCISKKQEISRADMKGLIDYAITFEEMWELFREMGVEVKNARPSEPDSPYADKGYLIPITGGLISAMQVSGDLHEQDYIAAEGPENCLDLISAVATGEIDVKFLDLLFCRGCIDGPKTGSDRSLARKKSEIINVYNDISPEIRLKVQQSKKDYKIELARFFADRSVPLKTPGENEIREILALTDKYSSDDELNCGACGYPSCREKAIAVFQGIAEVEMCLPYLVAKKTQLLETLEARLENERELNVENTAIIQCSYDGITVTDGEGNIIKVNPALEKLFNMKSGELIGHNVEQLEKERIVYPSATMLAIRQKKPVTFLQKLKSGKEVLATGNPVLDENGNVTKVIVNIRDFAELEKMRSKIEEGIASISTGDDFMEDFKLIARSPAILDLVDMVKKLAVVDSTLLIYGESGTGKEVLTRLIHHSGARKNGPFVKINCGAIPENLIESELFGYETGAFTGAKRQGKPGLLEVGSGGTVFLDEVGELPLSQQVKLLRVLQEKKIIRIGGTNPINIDIRVIAATNRDLSEMVKKGEFRADLYYRLSVVPLKVPPLRERREDILPLAHYFLVRFNKKYGTNKYISDRLKNALLEYNWPGNIRELENLMERLTVTARGNYIEPEDLPRSFQSDEIIGQSIEVKGMLPLKKALEEVEKQLLLQAKERYNSTYKMAEILEVNQSTIVRKLKKYTDNAE